MLTEMPWYWIVVGFAAFGWAILYTVGVIVMLFGDIKTIIKGE